MNARASSRRVWAVLPVKSFAHAKTRLAPLLDGQRRAELAGEMLADVLAALRSAQGLRGALVITRDPDAVAIAKQHGAEIVHDPVEDGPNAAIRFARPALRRRDADAMVVVPSDVPQIEPTELEPILQSLVEPSIALALAMRDGGTNLFGCAPFDLLSPCFGPDSFARYLAAARRAGLEPRCFAPPSLMFDIDRPEDIHLFDARRPTRTGRYLARWASEASVTAGSSAPLRAGADG